MAALQRELAWVGVLGAVLLAVIAAVLAFAPEPASALQWLLQSQLLWLVVWVQAWRCRHLNHAENSPLHPDLGLANRLTLLRGGLIAATGGFLFQPQFAGLGGWLPALLYSVAAILDRVDGYVARRSGRRTLLGSDLDTRFDALGLLVAPLLAVAYAKIHWSYLAVSAAYYLFQLGLYWRRNHGLPVYPLLPNMLRRTLAGFQMGLIAVVLWPPFQPELTRMIGVAFMLPVLGGFWVDWLVVSGRIDARTPDTAARFADLDSFAQRKFLPGLRVLLVLTLWLVFRDSGLPLRGDAEVPWYGLLLAWGLLLAAIMIGSGIAARSGALLLLLLLAWHSPDSDFDFATYLVIFSAVWIMLLGSGRFSLWQPDAAWINRQDG